MWVLPPLPGVTPPTSLEPYSSACSEWNVPCWPVKPWQMTLVFLSINTLIVLSLDRSHGLACCVVQIQRRGDLQARIGQEFAALFHVRALEAHNHGNRQADLFHRGDDALRDQIAAHDAAEDVDQDAAHLVRRQDQLEGFGD